LHRLFCYDHTLVLMALARRFVFWFSVLVTVSSVRLVRSRRQQDSRSADFLADNSADFLTAEALLVAAEDEANSTVHVSKTFIFDDGVPAAEQKKKKGLFGWLRKKQKTPFEEMVARWAMLPYSMPSSQNKLQNIAGVDQKEIQEEIMRQAKSTRPIAHPLTLMLMDKFLKRRKEKGTSIERGIYAGMDLPGFVVRLMTMRPLMFLTNRDNYLLRDGANKDYGVGEGVSFDDIGTKEEEPPLLMEEYLSYEEMELSALLGMSVPTWFINKGSRGNKCRKSDKGDFEKEGVLMGLVGCRFERKNVMDWKHMVVTKDQNTEAKGYGANGSNTELQMWSDFYGVPHFATYDEAQKEYDSGGSRFISGGTLFCEQFLDTVVYQARMEYIAEMFLAEANERAKAAGKIAYCHLVGLGLGVWKVHDQQKKIQAAAYITVAKRMNLSSIGELHFSYFGRCVLPGDQCKKGSVKALDETKIKIVFDKRNTADKLPKAGKKPWLLVAQYAWDGNSYPGNEYWDGKHNFAASGDPAAACASYIPELQNPEINVEAFRKERIHTTPRKTEIRRRYKPKTVKRSSTPAPTSGCIYEPTACDCTCYEGLTPSPVMEDTYPNACKDYAPDLGFLKNEACCVTAEWSLYKRCCNAKKSPPTSASASTSASESASSSSKSKSKSMGSKKSSRKSISSKKADSSSSTSEKGDETSDKSTSDDSSKKKSSHSGSSPDESASDDSSKKTSSHSSSSSGKSTSDDSSKKKSSHSSLSSDESSSDDSSKKKSSQSSSSSGKSTSDDSTKKKSSSVSSSSKSKSKSMGSKRKSMGSKKKSMGSKRSLSKSISSTQKDSSSSTSDPGWSISANGAGQIVYEISDTSTTDDSSKKKSSSKSVGKPSRMHSSRKTSSKSKKGTKAVGTSVAKSFMEGASEPDDTAAFAPEVTGDTETVPMPRKISLSSKPKPAVTLDGDSQFLDSDVEPAGTLAPEEESIESTDAAPTPEKSLDEPSDEESTTVLEPPTKKLTATPAATVTPAETSDELSGDGSQRRRSTEKPTKARRKHRRKKSSGRGPTPSTEKPKKTPRQRRRKTSGKAETESGEQKDESQPSDQSQPSDESEPNAET